MQYSIQHLQHWSRTYTHIRLWTSKRYASTGVCIERISGENSPCHYSTTLKSLFPFTKKVCLIKVEHRKDILTHKQQPIFPSHVSYAVSVVSIVEKIQHVLTRPHSICCLCFPWKFVWLKHQESLFDSNTKKVCLILTPKKYFVWFKIQKNLFDSSTWKKRNLPLYCGHFLLLSLASLLANPRRLL